MVSRLNVDQIQSTNPENGLKITVNDLQNDVVFFKARKTSVQVIGDTVEDFISFETEDYNTANSFSNTTSYTVPENGLYKISAQISADNAGSALRDMVIGILTSTDDWATNTTIDTTGHRYYNGSTDIQSVTQNLNSHHYLVANTNIKIRCYINTDNSSGTNIAIDSDVIQNSDFNRSGFLTWFEVLKVGNIPS